MEQQRHPLLTDSGEQSRWRSYQYVERSRSIHLPPLSGVDLTVQEIRSAASSFADSSYYPPSLHDPFIRTPPSDHSHPHGQEAVFQGGYSGGYFGNSSNNPGRYPLDEVEIRQLLVDHIGHRCCWGSRPARTWKIVAIEDCNVYVGTLETFIEERESNGEIESYQGGNFDGRDNGPELGIWELDLRADFPPLFVPLKETVIRIPHSETVTKCSSCEGRGQIPCQTCNVGQEPGHYKENQMAQCLACYGRGLIAHKDGSDTICARCGGKGTLPCVSCASRGLVKCQVCQGQGSLLDRKIANVKWRTLSTRKVIAASGAASVPDDVFHSAKGVELCNTQAYQCAPAYFADSYFLNKFSSDVIADRPHIPPAARIICERHAISMVPVTRVTMARRNKSFSFYIVGLGRDVYVRHYPSKFCWGLCCCLEWVGM